MKYIIIITAFIFQTSIGFSQLNDSLVPAKTEMLEKFFTLNYGRLAPVNNYLSQEDFLQKLDSFRNYAYAQPGNSGDLQKKDINSFAFLVLNQYINTYGIDTVKEEEFYKLIRESKEMDSATEQKIEAAGNARFVKKLSAGQKDSLTSLVMNSWNINDSALFKSSRAFRDLVEARINYIMGKQYPGEIETRSEVELIKQKIVNEVINDEFINSHYSYKIIDELLKLGEDSAVIDSAYKQYMAGARNKEYRDKIAVVYHNYKTYIKNAPAPDFNYKDVNGKTVSLKSLRGKYVYIDIWATWCGPCKMEIPHLAKLEEKYKNRNIHFVSLSIDKMSDKPVWEKYVKSNKLKGIQLIADNEDFIRKFNINFIPRFILIAPDGKIVETDAKRPSDKSISDDFNAML